MSKIMYAMFLLVMVPVVFAGSWSGYVLDSSSLPLTGVNVSAHDAATDAYVNSALTNTSGAFRVDGVTNSVYLVSSLAGYTTDYTQDLPPAGANNYTLPFNITLSVSNSPGNIAGTVSNSTGPLVNAAVRALQGGVEIASTTTNAAGAYTISNITHGTYVVEASATGYVTQNTTNVVVSPGATTNGVDFVLSLPPPSCTEDWTCTAWSACSGGVQTRTCTDLNSCGTEVNKPAESRSCDDGGSSGGGGGYDGTDYRISLTNEGVQQRLRKEDRVRFYFKGELHEVEITGISTYTTSFLVKSEPIAASLEVDQIGKYDVDNDDVYDLKISVDDISFYRTTMTFFLINEPMIVQEPETTTTQTSNNNYVPPPAPKPKKEIIVEDIAKQETEETKEGLFNMITSMAGGAFAFTKKIPYLGYVSAGIVILLIIIVAIKLFKSEETVTEEDISQFNKDELKRRIARLEKQITKLKRTI